jgi:hypothetical protein
MHETIRQGRRHHRCGARYRQSLRQRREIVEHPFGTALRATLLICINL